MRYLFTFLTLFCLIFTRQTQAQSTDSLRAQHTWNAQWIAINNPLDKGTGYGVYYFRKSIELNARPAKFIIHLSADN